MLIYLLWGSAVAFHTWWRHQMETFSALLALCAGTSSVPGEFPTQRPVTRSFDVFFDLCLNKPVCKQSWGWWFETPAHSLWRHYNDPNSVYFPQTIRHTRVKDLGVAALHPGIDFSSQSHVSTPCPFVKRLYMVPLIFMWVLSNPLQIPIIYHNANHVGTFFVIFLIKIWFEAHLF